MGEDHGCPAGGRRAPGLPGRRNAVATRAPAGRMPRWRPLGRAGPRARGRERAAVAVREVPRRRAGRARRDPVVVAAAAPSGGSRRRASVASAGGEPPPRAGRACSLHRRRGLGLGPATGGHGAGRDGGQGREPEGGRRVLGCSPRVGLRAVAGGGAGGKRGGRGEMVRLRAVVGVGASGSVLGRSGGAGGGPADGGGGAGGMRPCGSGGGGSTGLGDEGVERLSVEAEGVC